MQVTTVLEEGSKIHTVIYSIQFSFVVAISSAFQAVNFTSDYPLISTYYLLKYKNHH